jgi:hypothetical protein
VPPPAQKNQQKDAKQMALRKHKKNWSAATSALIARLIEFKRGLNGRGSAKANIPPSRIQEELPDQVSSSLSQLTQEFSKIVADAESIISEQANYSQTRRKKQPKQPKAPVAARPTAAPPTGVPATAPGVPDAITQQLQSLTSLETFAIEKYGSTRLSRFWQYITSVFSRKEFNRARLGMLSLSADLFYNILDFQNAVLTLGIKNVPQAITKYQNLQNTYKALHRLFEQAAKLLVQKAESEGVEPPTPEEEPTPEKTPKQKQQRVIDLREPPSQVIKDILRDINIISPLHLVAPEKLYNIKSLIEKNPYDIDHIKNEYIKVLAEVFMRARQEFSPTPVKTLQDIVDLSRKNAGDINSPLAKYAHNVITRALRRQLVKMIPFDKTATPRIQAADAANEAKRTVKRLMDVLEQDIAVDEIVGLLKEIEKQIIEVGKFMSVLNLLYKEKFLTDDRGKDLDFALRRRLRRDIFQGIE